MSVKNRPYLVVGIALMFTFIIRQFPATIWASGLTRNYLPLHILLEFVVVLVSFGIANVGLATYRNTKDLHLLVLGGASIVIGAFDLGHTLTFTGMPDFFGPSALDKTIAFWLFSRGFGASVYLYVACSKSKKILWDSRFVKATVIAAALLLIAIVYDLILFHDQELPHLFIPGQGLTPLKIILEWACVILSAIASFFLFRRAEGDTNLNLRWMACACALYAMCGYFFTIYHDFDDLYVFTGHVYKAISSLMLYRAVFAECVSKPYERAETLAAEAAAASQAKSRFLANVSHELRTPLGIISGFGELVQSSEKLDPTLNEWMKTLVKNSKQLGFLIDDLLDLTKVEQEKIDLNITKFDVKDMILQIVKAFEIQAKNKNIALEFHSQLPAGHLVGTDENRLRQILMNLISNSFKFTKYGKIAIEVKKNPDDKIQITVNDTGIGISQADVANLFKPFSQVGDASRRTFGGTGLGLVVSRNMAQLLGGSLDLTKSKLGSGSEFCLVIENHEHDLHIPAPAAPPQAMATILAPDFSGKKILIAEDSPDNRMLLKTYLKATAVEIDFAENGKEAVKLVGENKYHLVLMDLQMPEMDGFEATLQLRATGWKGTIVALTAHALQPERDRALQNGFNGYLIKPITKTELWNELKNRIA